MIPLIILENLTKAKFSIKTTNTSYYDDFLDQRQLKYMQNAKNRDGKIVQMTPEEYYTECAKNVFDCSVDYLLDSRKIHDDIVEKYRSDMKSGDTFPLCYINYASKQQEGLHRMLAAGEEFGWNVKYPVLVVTVYDKEIEDLNERQYNLQNYFKYGFKDDLEKVKDEMNTMYDAYRDYPPDDITKILQKVLYKVSDSKLKARVYVDYADVGCDMLFPESVHFEPVIYDGLNVSDYIDPQYYAKNFYIFVEDMFYFPVDDPDEMEIICQPVYDDAEV